VISTNVAETGITIKSLKYVIDSGYNKEIEFNPNFGTRGLLTRPAPRSRIQQRMGRVGRLFYGYFYPLYSEHVYNSVGTNQLPQILVEDISPIILRVICEQLRNKKLTGRESNFRITDIDMLDVPAQDSIHYAIEKLFALGFLSMSAPPFNQDVQDTIAAPYAGHNFGLSKLGILATLFGIVAPESIRMILSGYSWGCHIGDLITIAAYMSIPAKDFVVRSETPVQKNINWEYVYKTGVPGFLAGDGEIYRVRALIADEFIDGIIIYSAAKQIISNDLKMSMVNLQRWCNASNIKYDTLISFIRERDSIIEQLLSNEFDVFGNPEHAFSKCNIDNFMDTICRIKYCIYDGFRMNMATWRDTHYEIIGGASITTPKLFRADEELLAKQASFEFVTKLRPRNVLYNSLELKLNKKTSMYSVVVDRISVLDGFVNIDFNPF
jgi:HrpA-like RNA helicase